MNFLWFKKKDIVFEHDVHKDEHFELDSNVIPAQKTGQETVIRNPVEDEEGKVGLVRKRGRPRKENNGMVNFLRSKPGRVYVTLDAYNLLVYHKCYLSDKGVYVKSVGDILNHALLYYLEKNDKEFLDWMNKRQDAFKVLMEGKYLSRSEVLIYAPDKLFNNDKQFLEFCKYRK